MKDPEDDPFRYDLDEAGTYNDHKGWRPWRNPRDTSSSARGAVVADPRKGTGLKQWAQPSLQGHVITCLSRPRKKDPGKP